MTFHPGLLRAICHRCSSAWSKCKREARPRGLGKKGKRRALQPGLAWGNLPLQAGYSILQASPAALSCQVLPWSGSQGGHCKSCRQPVPALVFLSTSGSSNRLTKEKVYRAVPPNPKSSLFIRDVCGSSRLHGLRALPSWGGPTDHGRGPLLVQLRKLRHMVSSLCNPGVGPRLLHNMSCRLPHEALLDLGMVLTIQSSN
jgi:hypothetical protein